MLPLTNGSQSNSAPDRCHTSCSAEYRHGGRTLIQLGLVTLVTPTDVSYAQQIRSVFNEWITSFRTGGLDSWRLRSSKEADAGRMLITNYAGVIGGSLETIKELAPGIRLDLFNWYTAHVEQVMSEKMKYKVAYAWCCGASDIAEINKWCESQGIKCEEK